MNATMKLLGYRFLDSAKFQQMNWVRE